MYLAKSDPIESLVDHTAEVLERFFHLKELYQAKLTLLTERDWDLLELAILYHDIGKVDIVFQNKIREKVGFPSLDLPYIEHEILHNFLSVMAIPFAKLGLDKEEKEILAQIVAYHHERELPDKNQVAESYAKNILPYISQIQENLNVMIQDEKRFPILTRKKYRINIELHQNSSPGKLNVINPTSRIQPIASNYLRYVLLKGMLHRLDHAASAHVPIELATEMNVGQYVGEFFQKNQFNMNDLQQFTKEYQDHHLVVVAQTGMGKTEAGLLWLGKSKGFFTLPLRVSINALYDRITDEDKIGFIKRSELHGEEATGILHSTSFDHLVEQIEADDKVLEKIHSQSRQFSNKLIISTIDQILKFPFYYLGFEKEYAIMATCKVIIDELQAYDPKIAALLIRAMKLIDEIGGSFMIMTATLPEFYLQALQQELGQSRIPLTCKKFVDDSIKRHRISILDQSILDQEAIQNMKEAGKIKKVLVICNTVDQAKKVYESFGEDHLLNIRLLHARFTKRDRSRKEREIIKFADDKDAVGIWITTQLVEASLDIDFDILYTEMSTLDSQFQRYGRVNRKGEKPTDNVNIFVFTQDVSGVNKDRRSVYHYEIFDRSLKLLKAYNDELLLESTKQELIKELYSPENIKGTQFEKEFNESLEQLRNRPHYNINKHQAQELLRDIDQVQVIPSIYLKCGHFRENLDSWKRAKTKSEKRKRRMEIESYSVSVNRFRAEKIGIQEIEDIKGLYYINCQYSPTLGLLTEDFDIFD